MEGAKVEIFDEWFERNRKESAALKYCHLLLVEDNSQRHKAMPAFCDYVYQAHEPARLHLRKPFEERLHPADLDDVPDPADGYPGMLDGITLQGYLGEILAGLVAEHCTHLESDQWEVPAFLFHTHDLAFQQLEIIKQTGEPSKKIFGRTGDDCLAFERDNEGTVKRVLCCEAKLTKDHSAKLIKENHEKLSSEIARPVHVARIIEALKLLPESDWSTSWVRSLQEYCILGRGERVDLASYACGKKPQKETSWIDRSNPHRSYTGGRYLVAAEIHLHDVEELVETTYSSDEKG